VDKVKMGIVQGRKRTKTDKWFRAMMRDRKKRRLDGKSSENRMSFNPR